MTNRVISVKSPRKRVVKLMNHTWLKGHSGYDKGNVTSINVKQVVSRKE